MNSLERRSGLIGWAWPGLIIWYHCFIVFWNFTWRPWSAFLKVSPHGSSLANVWNWIIFLWDPITYFALKAMASDQLKKLVGRPRSEFDEFCRLILTSLNHKFAYVSCTEFSKPRLLLQSILNQLKVKTCHSIFLQIFLFSYHATSKIDKRILQVGIPPTWGGLHSRKCKILHLFLEKAHTI